MQKILQIKVCNIGPIRGERVVDFNPNALLTTLTGHNGVGKSTILKAIAQAQTGVLLSAKDDILNVHTRTGYIEAQFLGVDGSSIYTHHIGFGKGESTWLKTPESELRGSKEIGAYITSFHTVSPRTLLKTNFVRQGDLSAIMSDLRSDRAKVISELSGTDNAETVWKNLGEYVGRFNINDAAPAIYERSQEALKEANDLSATAKAQLAVCPKVDDNEEVTLHKVLSLFEKKRAASTELAGLPDESLLKADSVRLTGLHKTAKSSCDVLNTKLAALPAKQARQYVDLYHRAEELIGQKEKQELLRDKLATWRESNLTRPVIFTDEPVALVKEQTLLEGKQATLRVNLKSLGTGVCHACNQKLPHAEDTIAAHTCDLDSVTKRLAAIAVLLEGVRNTRQVELDAVAKYDKTFTQYEVKKKECDDFFQRLARLCPPSAEEYKAAAITLIDHEQCLKDITAANATESKIFLTLTTAQAKLDTVVARSVELKKAIIGGPTQQAYDDAKEKLSRISLLRKAYNEAESNVKVATFAVDSRQKELDTARRVLNEYRKNQRIVTQLQAMRDLVHRDSLPAKISAQFLARTALRAQEYLRPFEADFVLSADVGEMSFIAEYADGKRLRIDQLSGGWTTATALALRCATSDLISKINKTLILDECIVFLDADNMARVPMVLDKIKSVNKQVGRQMLMVTHEPNLLAVADSVISLD